VRIGLADDSLLFREGLARLVGELGFEVAFQAADVEQLQRAMQREPADVVIVDVRMPPTFTSEGIAAARKLRADHPSLGVVVLSQYVESSQAARLLGENGRGVGYLLKDRVSDLSALSDAIRRVAAGGTVIDPEVISRLLTGRDEQQALGALTPREREVLALMAEGHSNAAIAERLFIGLKTVETHIGTIFSKLELLPDDEVDRRVRAVLTYLRA
jgi:DNA-binding NarL/FixJ family response regulator